MVGGLLLCRGGRLRRFRHSHFVCTKFTLNLRSVPQGAAQNRHNRFVCATQNLATPYLGG